MESKANLECGILGEENWNGGENPLQLRLLDLLIKRIIKKLEENSYEPKVQDALKAIQIRQKLVQTSEAEKIFWQLIDQIRKSELEESNPPKRLEAQILRTIIGLKEQVKKGVLPVKTITDAFNQGKSEKTQLTYHRIGRILSTMGFTKAKVKSSSAIVWDERNIKRLAENFGLPQTQETPERRETHAPDLKARNGEINPKPDHKNSWKAE